MSELNKIALKIISNGKGILAADESNGTMTKRLSSVNVESTSENRLKFRETLFSAEGMKNHNYKSVSKAIPFPILTEKQMQGYDLVVCCVDNLGVRRTLYNTSLKWLDLRAQGRNAALVSHKANPEMYDMLLAGDDRSYSCQGDSWDGTNKNVHFMQVAIAGLGAQWIQRWFNEEQVREYMVVNV